VRWGGEIFRTNPCDFAGNGQTTLVLLDSLSLSRHGESSGELSSVMILNPGFGNSLWKVRLVGQ